MSNNGYPPPPPRQESDEGEDLSDESDDRTSNADANDALDDGLFAPPPPPGANATSMLSGAFATLNMNNPQGMRGYLTKLPLSYHESSALRKLTLKGRKRFFVLNENQLEYYESESDTIPKGVVTLGPGSYVVPDKQFSQRFQVGFLEGDLVERRGSEDTADASQQDTDDHGKRNSGQANVRVLHLEAQNEVDRENWIQAVLAIVPAQMRGEPGAPVHEGRERTQSALNRMTRAQQRRRAESDLASLLSLPDDEAESRTVRKQGYLWKKGGSNGGRHNWNKRYFVLTNSLSYLKTKEDFEMLLEQSNHGAMMPVSEGQVVDESSESEHEHDLTRGETRRSSTEPIWYKTIPLDSFSASKRDKYEGQTFDFEISTLNTILTCRAENESEREEWIRAIMEPLRQDEESKFTDCLYGEDEEYKRLSKRLSSSSKNPQPKEFIRASRQLQLA